MASYRIPSRSRCKYTAAKDSSTQFWITYFCPGECYILVLVVRQASVEAFAESA